MIRIGYAKMMDSMTCDSRYLIVLVKMWNTSTNTFILPIGECTITLKDIYRIFKVLIEGDPIIKLRASMVYNQLH